MQDYKGMRIGAVLSVSETEVLFLGYGTYLGDEVPPPDIGGLNLGFPNPKLELDNGDVVWGCECWWGPEEDLQEKLKNTTLKIIDVNIKDTREKYKNG